MLQTPFWFIIHGPAEKSDDFKEDVLWSTSGVSRRNTATVKRWLAEQRAFAVETYFRNNDSVVMTQRIFRRHFS